MFQKVFTEFDLNGNGIISTSEFSKVMQQMGQELNADEMKDLLQLIDDDNSGSINFQEFLKLMELIQENDNKI